MQKVKYCLIILSRLKQLEKGLEEQNDLIKIISMKTIIRNLLYLFIIILIAGCDNESDLSERTNDLAIIPKPVTINQFSGEFELKSSTLICHSGEELLPLAEYLADEISIASGLELQIKEGKGSGISLSLQEDLLISLGTEGYKLNISSGGIEIVAGKTRGLFYGIQTLLQMIPANDNGCEECEENEDRKSVV